MAHLAIYNDNKIIIASGAKILLLNPITGICLNTFNLPSNKKQLNTNNNALKNEKELTNYPTIQHLVISPNHQLLAITTNVDKQLYLYSCSPNDIAAKYDLISQRNLTRTSSAVKFSSDSQSLLVADKGGDCYLYDCIQVDRPGKLLMGHLSMILDCTFTKEKKFIITCDRDEKIRLTHYPQTHLIEGYCLGHTEYVSALAFLPTNPTDILLSVSGDRTLKFWQLSTERYKELHSIELEAPGLILAVKKYANTNHIAVAYLDCMYITIYTVVSSNQHEFHVNQIEKHEFNQMKSIASMQYDLVTGSLHISGLTSDRHILLQKLNQNIDGKYTTDALDELNRVICNELDVIPAVNKTVDKFLPMLFKKKFDNVHDYHERKKRRIEEGQNKNQI